MDKATSIDIVAKTVWTEGRVHDGPGGLWFDSENNYCFSFYFDKDTLVNVVATPKDGVLSWTCESNW